MAINKLKNHSNSNISKLASDLVDKWKSLLSTTSKRDHSTFQKASKIENNEKKHKANDSDTISEISLPSPQASITDDNTRDKCIHMLYTALQVGIEEKKNDDILDFYNEGIEEFVMNLAITIESCLFKEFNTINTAYKAKFRSKYLNLKEKTNPHLRQSLLNGQLIPERFIQLSIEEMASEERRQADAIIQKENLQKSQAARDTAAETDMFQCGKCKQRKCKYFQLQTRSADEPMTTYVTCMNCNNRWKC